MRLGRIFFEEKGAIKPFRIVKNVFQGRWTVVEFGGSRS